MKNSTFMRKYFNSAYEDPLWNLIDSHTKCREVYDDRTNAQAAFREMLQEANPELCKIFDDLSNTIFHFEYVLFEEFYILGVQDRDKALALQE